MNVICFQVTTWDWTRAEKSFTVYEIMCKILKVRQPFPLHFISFREATLTLKTLGEYKVEN